MPAPLLTDVFGSQASQDANNLTISKADLMAVGFTPAAVNSAESLFVSLLLLASQKLTETNRSTDLANRKVTVSYIAQDLVSQQTSYFLRDAFTILLYKPTDQVAIDPDFY